MANDSDVAQARILLSALNDHIARISGFSKKQNASAVTRTHLAVIPKHPYVATCTRRIGTWTASTNDSPTLRLDPSED
jgi:hypothetical protein